MQFNLFFLVCGTAVKLYSRVKSENFFFKQNPSSIRYVMRIGADCGLMILDGY